MGRLLPFDGLVWILRERSWATWAEREWAHPDAVSRAMSKRGWTRDDMGGLTHAPCASCGRRTEVEVLSCRRICETCRYGPVPRELAMEMVGYLTRHPNYPNEEVRR